MTAGSKGAFRRSVLRRVAVGAFMLPLAVAAFVAAAPPARADDHGWRWADGDKSPVWSISAFAGEDSKRYMTQTIYHLYDFQGTNNYLFALAGGRELVWYKDYFSFDAELLYAHHAGQQSYEEAAASLKLVWHDFPWNDFVLTSFGVGLGPSITNIYPEVEARDPGQPRSKVLNQLNLELTLALPDHPNTALIGRIQHRSGFFGRFGGASEFLTFGLKQKF